MQLGFGFFTSVSARDKAGLVEGGAVGGSDNRAALGMGIFCILTFVLFVGELLQLDWVECIAYIIILSCIRLYKLSMLHATVSVMFVRC